jgi:hypothetical protein
MQEVEDIGEVKGFEEEAIPSGEDGAGDFGEGKPSRFPSGLRASRANMGNGSMDFDYCQGNSTIILSFERETGKRSGWKELAGIL